MSLPGRMPGHKDYHCMVLPVFLTKKKAHLKYVEACEVDGRKYISERVFGNYWRELHPRIMFFLYGNHERKKDLTEKSAALLRQEAHIKEAIVQR